MAPRGRTRYLPRAYAAARPVPFTHPPTAIARRSSPRPQAPREPQTRINEQIRSDRVRVVDPDAGEHGVMTLDQALTIARSRQLDLVEISANAEPPVVKIMDFGKYRYEQQKKDKEQRKKQARTSEMKEIRFRPNTDDHDFEFKTKHAREFLGEGHKVKAWVQFRGRDIVYKDRGEAMLSKFVEVLSDVSKLDQPPSMEGRRMTIMLAPEKKK
ncbi:MAG TPA: translation initiation factor IF-3 [Rhodothermales bacterium]|nr:translation initiation factor IF-3 [Rhodothermales bacterium]